ncbi:uncharacterized protein F5891DRAFT_1183583 [Suillus fuscotomentosus]|uniref:Uncharacterized protein n=1 Tax=Suillus fuscotomentosus TaxID=1912939 RepID=A0AAD4EF66_9AGAM|nr:uncharacterized protein F5891DRAFT_1183583 [Suillus fuscotomentosus]KAG1904937.1 hypothetical protein F5891DRAFT_1183583 [Suillus fuscotomentosus]
MAFITIPASKKHKSLLDYDKDDADKESDANDDGKDDEPVQSQPTKMLTPPPTTSRKQKHRNKNSPSDPKPLAQIKEVTFIMSITSAAEMKKPASHNIAGFAPEPQNPKPGALGKSTGI